MKSNYNDFKASLKYDDNCDIVKLLKIQRKLDEGDINKEKIRSLISNLSEYEKNKIIQLYTKQINSLNNSINNYKYKIIKERKQLKV